MSNTHYSIDDGNGNTLAAGLQPHLARKVAQERADERHASVWLYEPDACRDGLDNDGEEITPELNDDGRKTPARLRP